jgi:hypothetical protein
VDNVVRLSLINADHPLFEYDISNELIKTGIFEKTDESELSKVGISPKHYFLNI